MAKLGSNTLNDKSKIIKKLFAQKVQEKLFCNKVLKEKAFPKNLPLRIST